MNSLEKLKDLSLKNKIFFSTLAVILLISLLIALFTRWIVISSLTTELKRRGSGIAHSISESSRGFILTENVPELTSLLFEARLGERKELIVYVFVLDKQGHVLSHTFTRPFPEGLHLANPIGPDASESIKLLKIGAHAAYDIAVPVNEGIYRIGTIHVGLNKDHIDRLIGKLRTTFVAFLSVVTVIFFIISHYLAKYITRPISELTKISDEISRGNFDIRTNLGGEIKCWEIQGCEKSQCPAYRNTSTPCWYVDGTLCKENEPCTTPEKMEFCNECAVYRKGVRDEVRQLANSFVNMTNRIKSSRIQLTESENKYRSLFHSGPNPIFVVDRQTLEILDANPAAEKAYGYSKEELKGKSFAELGPFDFDAADVSPRGGDEWRRSPIVNPKMRHFRNGDEPFYVNIHASPARYLERDVYIVGTTDITEMIEKDTQLIQASKMTTLGEMSAGIAHELNQPLNAIKLGNEYLVMMIETGREIPEKDLYDVAHEVSGQVDRAADIINRLRDFGRKADFNKERVSINAAIRAVVEIVEKQFELQNIDIELDLDEAMPPIMGHRNRLEQVVFNLLTNARDAINCRQETGDAADGQRKIAIRSFCENGRVTVTVTDTGVGIGESVKDRIFEAFFTTKQMGEGMGLGLSITSGIVGDYGGELAIDSEEGKGATFTLSFPEASGPPNKRDKGGNT